MFSREKPDSTVSTHTLAEKFAWCDRQADAVLGLQNTSRQAARGHLTFGTGAFKTESGSAKARDRDAVLEILE
jgi:hypothetical protein